MSTLGKAATLFKRRFTSDPPRPYDESSIADLVDLLDEAYKAQALIEGEDYSQMRRKPATEKQLAGLERCLCRATSSDEEPLLPGSALPDDYKEFLRFTNGFRSDNHQDKPNNSCTFFYGIEGIDTSAIMTLHSFPGS